MVPSLAWVKAVAKAWKGSVRLGQRYLDGFYSNDWYGGGWVGFLADEEWGSSNVVRAGLLATDRAAPIASITSGEPGGGRGWRVVPCCLLTSKPNSTARRSPRPTPGWLPCTRPDTPWRRRC